MSEGRVSADAIIIMAKQPRPGKTKTRLCPPFTYAEAAGLFEALLKDTIALTAGLEQAQLAVAVSPPESLAYFESITPPGTILLAVEGANIGVCLERALCLLLEQGYRRVLALNADGPSLPREYLIEAIQKLDGCDVVLGPGEDGGYYLIGLKTMYPALFEAITWSSPLVLEQTLAQAKQLGLRVGLTAPWYDIDSPADVDRLRRELAELPVDRLVTVRRFFGQITAETWQP